MNNSEQSVCRERYVGFTSFLTRICFSLVCQKHHEGNPYLYLASSTEKLSRGRSIEGEMNASMSLLRGRRQEEKGKA